MLANPGESPDRLPTAKRAAAAPTFVNVTVGQPGDAGDAETLRQELDRLRDRERQILELLGTQSPDRLVHDLRNVLNELQLLRMLAEDKM